MYQVFPFARGYDDWVELKKTQRLKFHADSFIKTLDQSIVSLQDTTKIRQDISNLGERHFKYMPAMRPVYFEVGEKMPLKICMCSSSCTCTPSERWFYQCFPRVPTAGQNGQLLGLYWPATSVEDIKSCYLEVKASKSDKRL